MTRRDTSKKFWDQAARTDPAWHIARGYHVVDDAFFESGRREVDGFLRFAQVQLGPDSRLLEIGCGIGRMTRRFSELAGAVIAVDVSSEMLAQAAHNLQGASDVELLEVSGDGSLSLADTSVDAVFSYITMQHVPTTSAQEKYFTESLRVLKPGGWALIQYRRTGLLARTLDWAGHIVHLFQGRRSLSVAWRGARIHTKHLLVHASDTTIITVLPHNRRHQWVLARKQAHPGAD